MDTVSDIFTLASFKISYTFSNNLLQETILLPKIIIVLKWNTFQTRKLLKLTLPDTRTTIKKNNNDYINEYNRNTGPGTNIINTFGGIGVG